MANARYSGLGQWPSKFLSFLILQSSCTSISGLLSKAQVIGNSSINRRCKLTSSGPPLFVFSTQLERPWMLGIGIAVTTGEPEWPESQKRTEARTTRYSRKSGTTGNPELQEWLEGQEISLRQYIGATMSSSWTSYADRICRVYNLKLFYYFCGFLCARSGTRQDGTVVLAQISCLCLPKLSTSQHYGNFHSHPLIFTWRTKIIKKYNLHLKRHKNMSKDKRVYKGQSGEPQQHSSASHCARMKVQY